MSLNQMPQFATQVARYKAAGWRAMGAGNRGFRHKSGAAVVKAVGGMWVGVRVDASRRTVPGRWQAMRWALGQEPKASREPEWVRVPKPKPVRPPRPSRRCDDRVLAVVREHGPLPMAAIVKKLGLSTAGAHAPLVRLWEGGKIKRELSAIEGRGRRSYLWEVAA